MAKRKTPKTVELKARAEQITEAQHNKLKQALSTMSNYQTQIGSLEARKHELLHVVFEINELVNNIRQEIKKEYGTDNIDLATGKINYNEK